MFRKNIFAVLLFVFVLAMAAQYNRTDGFLYLMKNVNAFSFGKQDKEKIDRVFALAPDNARDHFLILYDGFSMRTVFNSEKIDELLRSHKKRVTGQEIGRAEVLKGEYSAVIVVAEYLDRLSDIDSLLNYADTGGTVIFAHRPETGDKLEQFYGALGIQTVSTNTYNPYGIRHVSGEILLGADGYVSQQAFFSESSLNVRLVPSAKLHIESYDGLPLVWENTYGKGRFIFYNNTQIGFKDSVGVLTALLGLSSPAYLYPVIGSRVLFIDDFPAPVPPGVHPKIFKEFQLTTAQFYRQIWWPEMLGHAQRYGYKYTGLIIEDYNDQVTPPFEPLDEQARIDLITYGRELLKSGGELGIHGYNHQSLAPAGYGQEKIGYNIWQSKEDMVLSLKELKRYVESAYPQYTIRAYVPPSNIFSPEGREAVLEVFPDLKIFASLYSGYWDDAEKAYFQNYQRNKDGTYDMPRASSGFIMDESMRWKVASVVSAKGIFAHFVHPDQIFYENSKNFSWADMSKGYREIVEDVAVNYGWLRAATASEATSHMDDYLDTEYSTLLKDGVFTIYAENAPGLRAYYIMRTRRDIEGFTGCGLKKIGKGAYLINMVEPMASVRFVPEEQPADSARSGPSGVTP